MSHESLKKQANFMSQTPYFLRSIYMEAQHEMLQYAYSSRDGLILLFFLPIFLSSNSFIFYLFCSIFCSKLFYFAEHQ